VTEEAFNPYTVLGVDPSASEAEIKAAWREAAQKAHPDREGGSPERMMEVNEAYQVLCDPIRRAAFDSGAGTVRGVPLERRAKDFLLALVGIVIRGAPASANMVVLIMNGVTNQQKALKESRTKTQAEIEGLKLRLRRLRGPPENFIQDLIREEIAKGERLLVTYDLDELVMDKALEILRDFSYEEEMAYPTAGGLLGIYQQVLLSGGVSSPRSR
jgi:curved DNA-binding protein CbpA